jgi:membrane protein implicated in regulation of membrane protease activity
MKKTLIYSSIATAFLASSCCIGPLLFLLFGISVSSLGFLEVFAPYKWLFSTISVLILTYLWFDYLKQTKLTCEAKICKKYKRYLLVGTLFVAVFISYPYWMNYVLEYL